MSTEEELKVVQLREDITEEGWKTVDSAVRIECPIRYMSRVEIRQNLEQIAGQIQKAIMATHEIRNAKTMCLQVGAELTEAKINNKKYRDIQTERIVKRREEKW